MDTLRALLYGVSAQRPTHSLYIAGQQLPLEARMAGIFLGFLCATALLMVLGRLRAARTPSGGLGLACWGLIASTGLDGLNAFLFDGGLPHLYPPTTAARLFTGLGAGLGLAMLALPVVSSRLWRQPRDEAALEDILELATGLAIAGLLGALVLVGVAPLLWPIAVAMLIAVLVAFGVGNLFVVLLATGHVRHADGWSSLAGPLLSSLGLALLELAGLSAVRAWLQASFGFTWGV